MLKIRTQLLLGFGPILTILLFLGAATYKINMGSISSAKEILEDDVPGAIGYLQLLGKIGDMQTCIMGYLSGKTEDAEKFEEFYESLNSDFEDLWKLESGTAADIANFNEIKKMADDLVHLARNDIFGQYSPEAKVWAIEKAAKIETVTAIELKRVLGVLKSAALESDKARENNDGSVKSSVSNAHYYTEMAEETEDMVGSVVAYSAGYVDGKKIFLS